MRLLGNKWLWVFDSTNLCIRLKLHTRTWPVARSSGVRSITRVSLLPPRIGALIGIERDDELYTTLRCAQAIVRGVDPRRRWGQGLGSTVWWCRGVCEGREGWWAVAARRRGRQRAAAHHQPPAQTRAAL